MAEVTGQRIVSFAESTSPGTLDYLATDNATNGNRKVSYLTLSEKILDKLSTKTFSLDGSNKTVLEALAELYQADDTLNARIDNIITPSGQASLSELVDVRTNFWGEVFASAGEAVRVSDLAVSGFSTIVPAAIRNDWYGDNESDGLFYHTNTISIDTQTYRNGSTITVVFDTQYTVTDQSVPSNLRLWFASNNATPDENSVDVKSTVDSLLDAFNVLGPNRIMARFNIPSDWSYRYLQIPYTYQASVATNPNYVVYGAKGSSITVTDPNSDGNIVIS